MPGSFGASDASAASVIGEEKAAALIAIGEFLKAAGVPRLKIPKAAIALQNLVESVPLSPAAIVAAAVVIFCCGDLQ